MKFPDDNLKFATANKILDILLFKFAMSLTFLKNHNTGDWAKF